jgi:type IV secretion system protein VirB9
MMRTTLLCFSLLVMASPVAAQPPVPASVAPNIRYVDYHPDMIVRLTGHTGYQMMLEFEAGERIETVGIGDSSGWQVTPNGAGTVMFLKPVGMPHTTNLSIVTSRRRYNIELAARSGSKVAQSQIIYAVRFRYPAKAGAEVVTPAAAPLITTPPEQWNRAYSYDGAVASVPEQVFDDGKATYFRFAANASAPAIFSITPDAGESIVNFAVRGPYMVVEQVAPQFVLRSGKDVTYIFNEAYKAPVPGGEAPRKREKKKKRGLFSGLFSRPDEDPKPGISRDLALAAAPVGGQP